MDCPRCKLPLGRDRYENVEVDICSSCWGVWLDTGELETIIEAHHFHFSDAERKSAVQGRGPRDQGPIKPIPCPKCQARMERVYLDPKIYLVIDHCRKHGVWLDSGEIKSLQAMADDSTIVSKMLVQKIKKLHESQKS